MSNSGFTISQDYELLVPTKSKAYPVLLSEWTNIKDWNSPGSIDTLTHF